MLIRKVMGAALISTAVGLPALAQEFCQAAGDKVSLGFEVKPSLVAHSDAILDTTFGDAGETGGAPNERLFSFARTIGTILQSASAFGGANTPAAREAFVQTMIDSFALANGFALNPDAGVLMPLDARSGERLGLSAANLLDETSDQALKPLAVFNRFDLAPADWIHCGEHRIVYGKEKPDDPAPPNRFLLIFEAAVPNPDPAAGEAGCRPITEFWAELSAHAGDDTDLAKRLAAFFYEGKTDPTLAAPDLPEAVVHYKNYGGDGSRGQIRGNLFMGFPWQLREWLTQPTFDPADPLAFVVETVKDNPLAELYRDDLSGTSVAMANVPAAVTVLHGNFVASLTSDIRNHLMAEESQKHRDLVDDLERFELGIGPTNAVEEEKILLNTIALGNDSRFNEHQSTSLGPDDLVVAGPVLHTVLDQVGATTSPFPAVNPQTADVILARAQAGTCAGCHMTSPNEVVREIPNEPDVLWPEVAAGGFVHVREADRMLSPALEEHFLPVRRYILGRHLCPAAPPADQSVAMLAPGAGPAIGVPLDRSDAMRFVDAVVADFVTTRAPIGAAGAPAARAAEQSALATASIGQLDPVARNALRQKVHREIAEARRLEQNVSGAFVEVRRPH
jgi:hypothetical protein